MSRALRWRPQVAWTTVVSCRSMANRTQPPGNSNEMLNSVLAEMKRGKVKMERQPLPTRPPLLGANPGTAKTRQGQQGYANDQQPSRNVTFQCLGGGEHGGPRSLLLFTDSNRYLFNCGEGVQRLTHMYGGPVRMLTRLTNVFLTGRRWRNVGGLPGACLTAQNQGAPDIRVHGPGSAGAELFEAVRVFFRAHTDFNVLAHLTPEDGDFHDGVITVRHVPVEAHGAPLLYPGKSIYTDWDMIAGTRSRGAVSTDSRGISIINAGGRLNDYHRAAKNLVREEALDQTTMAYLVTLHGPPGNLSAKKCFEAGVPPGKLFAELRDGRDVVLEGGRVVRSRDVMSEEFPTQKVLVLECPTEYHLDALIKNPELNQDLLSFPHVPFVFHFSPLEVVRTKKYQSWMRSFKRTTRHVLLMERLCGTASLDNVKTHAVMNRLAPSLFPPLHVSHDETDEDDLGGLEGRSWQRFHTRPVEGLVDDSMLQTPPSDQVVEEKLREAFAGDEECMRKSLPAFASAEKNFISEGASKWPRTTFLGTGSSKPGVLRNVSCVLVQVDPENFLMLDCGENTYFQLVRHFGPARASDVLKRLRAIYISHLHSDHHMGLPNVLLARRAALNREKSKKLFIIATSKYSKFLSDLNRKFEPILEDTHFLSSEILLKEKASEGTQPMQSIYPRVKQDLLSCCGLDEIEVCRAAHCAGSFSLSFVTQDRYKLVYTGDTMPHRGLLKLGKESGGIPPDLLIHEATFSHMLHPDAVAKRHSTFKEAIDDGEKMGAGFTLLTHFSQRYSAVPLLDEVENRPRVGVAFDHLEVCPQTLHHLPALIPVLKQTFSRELSVMKEQHNRIQLSQTVGKTLFPGDEKHLKASRKRIYKSGGAKTRLKKHCDSV